MVVHLQQAVTPPILTFMRRSHLDARRMSSRHTAMVKAGTRWPTVLRRAERMAAKAVMTAAARRVGLASCAHGPGPHRSKAQHCC